MGLLGCGPWADTASQYLKIQLSRYSETASFEKKKKVLDRILKMLGILRSGP